MHKTVLLLYYLAEYIDLNPPYAGFPTNRYPDHSPLKETSSAAFPAGASAYGSLVPGVFFPPPHRIQDPAPGTWRLMMPEMQKALHGVICIVQDLFQPDPCLPPDQV